jgi:hypothetical protein
MAGLLDGIDQTNPCLVWPRLQEAYYKLLGGDREVRVKFANQAGSQEEVEFGAVDPKVLLAEIERLKAACARKAGQRTRYALTGRFRPRCY